jgi:hypothetical protein
MGYTQSQSTMIAGPTTPTTSGRLHMLSRRSFLVHQWKARTPERPWPPGRVAQLPEPFGYD